jgi:hypothetical protein
MIKIRLILLNIIIIIARKEERNGLDIGTILKNID